MQRRFLERGKSILGAALVGLGIFLLYENLDRAAIQLGHLFSTASGEALGALPTAILTASKVLQSYASNDRRFVHDLLLYVLIVSWPLLLVMVGSVLSRDVLTENCSSLPKRDCRSC